MEGNTSWTREFCRAEVEHSYKYRTLDNYLIDRDRWRRKQDVGFVAVWLNYRF